MFLIRDGNGEIYNEVNEPAVVVDTVFEIVLKIGEYSDMVKYFNASCEAYKNSTVAHMAYDLAVMSIPKDQDEIDKIFQNTGYIKKYIDKVIEK